MMYQSAPAALIMMHEKQFHNQFKLEISPHSSPEMGTHKVIDDGHLAEQPYLIVRLLSTKTDHRDTRCSHPSGTRLLLLS